MRLRNSDDQHNVYVLYSDLLFNLLILFTIFVLALVLRLNAGLRNVAAKEQSLSVTEVAADRDDARRERDQVKLDLLALQQSAATTAAARDQAVHDREELRQKMAALQQSVTALRVQADQAKAAAASQNDAAKTIVDNKLAAVAKQLAIAAGANRFTGRTGSSSLCVAVDLSGQTPRYVFVDAVVQGSSQMTLNRESDDEHKRRVAKLFRDEISNAERFDEAQLKGLFSALQTRHDKSASGEGSLFMQYFSNATFAASGWIDQDGDLDLAAANARVARLAGNADFGEYHTSLIERLLALRDDLRPVGDPATVPVLNFRADDRDHGVIFLGDQSYTVKQFREILHAFGDGGVILQYSGGGEVVCPNWVVNDILVPVGYMNAVPDPDELKRLRKQIDGTTVK